MLLSELVLTISNPPRTYLICPGSTVLNESRLLIWADLSSRFYVYPNFIFSVLINTFIIFSLLSICSDNNLFKSVSTEFSVSLSWFTFSLSMDALNIAVIKMKLKGITIVWFNILDRIFKHLYRDKVFLIM